MLTCKPWYGIGARHVQFAMMAIMNCMDYWTLELQKIIYLTETTDIVVYSRDEEGNIRAGVIEITEQQRNILYIVLFIAYTAGRFITLFLVPRVNNKYLLVGLIVFENVVSGTMVVWYYKYVGLWGISATLTMGAFCRGFHAPLMYNIMARWMPPSEYTTSFCIIAIVKDMFTFILSHLLLTISAMQALISFVLVTFVYLGWCALWVVFGAESPQTSFFISKQEWNHLAKTIGPRKKVHCKAKTPLKSIMTCGIIYAMVLFDFGREACSSIIGDSVNVIASRSAISGAMLICLQVAFMIYYFGFLTSCVLIDKAIEKEKIEVGPVRKIMTTVGCCGVSIMLILASYVDNSVAKISYLFLAQCFFVIVSTAEPTIYFDLSPNYASTNYSLVSFIRQFLVVGNNRLSKHLIHFDRTLKGANQTSHISSDVPDGKIYRYGFTIFFTNVILIISGNIHLKDYDSFDTRDWRRESVLSYP